jgi:precorrin-8X/cobalt-precorrin-8 methylmutase
MQHARPDFPEVVAELAALGAAGIVVHPYFLSSGQHVTTDVPRMMEEAAAAYPGIKFIYTEPLGTHEKLVDVAVERIREALRTDPLEIERRSFEIISEEAALNDNALKNNVLKNNALKNNALNNNALKNIPAKHLPIVKRIIHTTADFEYAETLVFHPRAVECAMAAIRAGRDILTDVEMVKAGINKRLAGRFGCRIVCGISDEPSRAEGDAHAGIHGNVGSGGHGGSGVSGGHGGHGKTRAAGAVERLFSERTGIVAVGNAPTALLKIMELLEGPFSPAASPPLAPAVVIGFPVGFVRALEAKMMLSGKGGIPHITNLSRKGGSAVAAAAVNALLKMAMEDSSNEK